jgi:uncharacterized Zn finger protein (UPF0148 family)
LDATQLVSETQGQEVATSEPAKFCPDCGTPTEGARFCSNCGRGTVAQSTVTTDHSPAAAIPIDDEEREVWRGAPDPLLSPVAAKTTAYVLTTERLKVSSGVVGRRADQMELFRVKDVQVKKNLRNRTRNRGDLFVISVDKSTPLLKLESIQNPDAVAETIRNVVSDSRRRHGVVSREFM